MAQTRALSLSPLMADPSHSWRPMAVPHGWRPKDPWPKPMPIISFSFSLFSHLSSQTWALSLLSWPIHLMVEDPWLNPIVEDPETHDQNPKTHGWRSKDPWPKSHHLSLWQGSFRGNQIWNQWGLACVLVFLVLCFDLTVVWVSVFLVLCFDLTVVWVLVFLVLCFWSNRGLGFASWLC